MQLRSWLPRHPSAKVKERLFGNPARVRQDTVLIADDSAPLRLNWLVPAALALVLTCILLNQRNGPLSYGTSSSQPIVATILSNQSAPPYFQREQDQHNHLPAATFEWTNGNGSTSSIRSLSLWRGVNYR
jgi:hypothetical protein